MEGRAKIAVVGLGGVGGCLASVLSKAYQDVTVVARGGRYDSVREKGLHLYSEVYGDIITHPKVVRDAGELGKMDFLFICVKNYSLEELLPHLSGAVGDDTVIIPVMNGVDPGDRVRAGVRGGTIIKSVIYIISYAKEDYSIHQEGKVFRFVVGVDNPKGAEGEALARLDSLLTRGGIPHEVAEDINLAIWKKYVLNCAYNVGTAYFESNIGGIRSDPEKVRIYEGLAREALLLGQRKGVALKEDEIRYIMDLFYSYREDASSSLQRDLAKGNPTELEIFGGYMVREYKRMGLESPISEKVYLSLKKRVEGTGQEALGSQE